MYHQIAATPPKGTPFRSLCVAPADFARQMAFLRRLGYQGLSMSGLMPYLSGERRGRVVGITFDDGYLNNLTHALPVLHRHSFSSTCYVVSQLLGQTNEWDRSIGIPQVPLMSTVELRQWVAGGQEVGSHTRHHARLKQITPGESMDEIEACKTELEGTLDVAVNHFCYPYGDYEASHVQMAKTAGYETATTTQRGRCHSGNSMFELPRITVARRTTRLGLWLKVATGYEDRARA
jgi:peptidoglycan/xylan/chitin deacetylase (PgdA/CDA1 family)